MEGYQKHPYSLAQFEAYVKEGILRKSEKDDLVLYGYTDKCTYDRMWTFHTRVARGIIFQKSTGNLIAKPFPKFFNIGEQEETMFKNLPLDKPYVAFEKVDGSLGIIFHHNGEWQLATRGSFYSKQALKGQEILKKYDLSQLDTNTTLLAEIVYPENKIIVNYGDKEELVLLAAYNRETEEEYDPMIVQGLSHILNMPAATVYYHKIEDMIAMQDTLTKDEEGFVVRFENGLRVKIKGFEYLIIAKLLARISPLALWESMKGGWCDRAYIKQLPEEFRQKYEPMAKTLESQYRNTFNEIIRAASLLPTLDSSPEGRKAIGLFLKDNKIPHSAAIFPLITKKSEAVEYYIMKHIRPKANVLKGEE